MCSGIEMIYACIILLCIKFSFQREINWNKMQKLIGVKSYITAFVGLLIPLDWKGPAKALKPANGILTAEMKQNSWV